MILRHIHLVTKSTY